MPCLSCRGATSLALTLPIALLPLNECLCIKGSIVFDEQTKHTNSEQRRGAWNSNTKEKSACCVTSLRVCSSL